MKPSEEHNGRIKRCKYQYTEEYKLCLFSLSLFIYLCISNWNKNTCNLDEDNFERCQQEQVDDTNKEYAIV